MQINEPRPQFFRQYWLFLALLLAATFILPLAGIPVAVILLWTVTTQSRQWVVAGPAAPVTHRMKIGSSAVAAAIFVGALLLGGGGSLSCSSGEAKGLVVQILKDKVKGFLDTYAATRDVEHLLAETDLALDAVRVQERDPTTKALTCAANFTSVIPPITTSQAFPKGETKTGSVVYHVEKTDDGRLYVTVLQGDQPY